MGKTAIICLAVIFLSYFAWQMYVEDYDRKMYAEELKRV